jgi:hypothetical protein
MGGYTITLNLNDQQRALIDEARGELDFEDYALAALLETASKDVVSSPLPDADDLTPADHMRLAEAAEANWLDLNEFEWVVREGIASEESARLSCRQ